MKRRIVTSFRELSDPNATPVFEEIKPKKIPLSASKFLNQDRGKGKYIKGDPESKGKSEAQIEKEIEAYLDSIDCAWWNTKVKGEIHATGKGRFILKESKNKGFGDITVSIESFFVMIEVKACGGYQSPDQIAQEEKVKKRGRGFYFLVTSVKELINFFTVHKLIKEPSNGAKR